MRPDQLKPAICGRKSAIWGISVKSSSMLTMISQNAGKDGGIVCEKVLDSKGNNGYNALTNTYEDLVKAGVIDPTKVTRTALANAASVATLLLTSDALIAEKPKDDHGHGKKKGHGGDYDMY